jgi:predicted TIM-barrel fold metal-dependent hydrolase
VAAVVDMHAHFDPRILDAPALVKKLDLAGVGRVVLIPCMNDPFPETPERLLSVVRRLSRSSLGRTVVESIHRALLTPEGDIKLSGRTIGIYARPDNDAVARLCEAHPDRFLGWMFLNPRNNPRVLDELEELRARRGMIGIKLHPHWHDWRTDLATPLLRRAEELGLPVLIHLGFGPRGDYRAICSKFPRLRVIAAHAGIPFYDELWRYARTVQNLYVDLSSPYIDERLARDTVAAMGPARCLYGTDAPYGFHDSDGSYDYTRIRSWIERMPISARDKERILFDNAVELLGLGEAVGPT